VRRIGEARVHGGCSHQFTGSYLARGIAGALTIASIGEKSGRSLP
jgi:hypothetical protein